MKKIILLMLTLLLITCDNPNEADQNNTSWVFVANEGNLGNTEGTISMIDDFGNVYETDIIGDVVNSLEVYEDKLIVLVNNSHMIKIYHITKDGLNMPGVEISTNGSSPRDLTIIGDKVYFTNWVTQDVKVFNLFNYIIEASIPIEGGIPENIEYDGEFIWVTIPHTDNVYFGTASTVAKIDPNTNSVIEIIEVGDGPQAIAFHNGEVYVSRTFYDADFNASHGATKIGAEITENIYGAGTPCGGAILKHQNTVYRSFDGGLSPMNIDLSLNMDNKIGNYDQSLIYHVEEINGNFWFALTDLSNYNEVKVIDFIGNEMSSYQVGKFPGDFAFWTMND